MFSAYARSPSERLCQKGGIKVICQTGGASYDPSDDSDDEAPVKKRKQNPSMRVKILPDTRVIDDNKNEIPINKIMRGSRLALSVQPKYLFRQSAREPYSLTFSVSLAHVRPSKDQLPTFLLDI